MSPAAPIALVTASAALLLAGAALAEDRYGPPPPVEPVEATEQAIPAQGWLTWSRKTAQPSPAPAPQPRTAPLNSGMVGAPLPTSLYGAASRTNGSPAPWTPAPRPRAAATPMAAPPQTAQAGGLPPHFYSVQREYAAAPETAPLPRQFFADSAGEDLAAPPPPLPPRPIPGSQAAASPANTAANRARATDLETSDSASN